MNIQVQKEEIAGAVEVIDLDAFRRLLGLVVLDAMEVRRAVNALGDALVLICGRAVRQSVAAVEARRRARLDRHRVMAMRDGEEPAKLSKSALKTLALADTVEAEAIKGKRGAPALRAQAVRMRERVGAQLDEATEARASDLRLAQTVALEAGREEEDEGAVIERRRGQKQVRLRTRDGLKLAHERGMFTPADKAGAVARMEADRLLAYGLRYRDRYEMAQASLRSCLADSERAAGQRNLYLEARAASLRVARANHVRVLDIAVVTRLGPDALEALRMVAGEARTLRSICSSSRRRAMLATALTDALRVIGDMFEKGH